MDYRLGADALVLAHFAFILFVVFGGFLVLWRHQFLWLHLPALAWGMWVEFAGWICPLTPWEQALRRRAGERGYSGGFIEHYLLAVIYPEGLTPAIQTAMGCLLLVMNVGIYVWIWRQRVAAKPAARRRGNQK